MSDLDLLTQVAGAQRQAMAHRARLHPGRARRPRRSQPWHAIEIEQARTNPSIGTVVKIGDALGVSITTLLDYEQGPKVRIVR